MNIIKSWRSQLDKLDSKLHPFVFSVHDWLAFFCDEPYLWNQYGTTLAQIVKERIQKNSSLVQSWTNEVLGGNPTLKTLLYRHYLVTDALSSTIEQDINFSSFYQVIGSMLVKDQGFVEYSFQTLWDGIDTDPYPINRLRHNQSNIRNFLHQLAMQDDIFPDQILIEHGMLSSLSLIYGLYLVRVIMIYEASLDPNPALQVMSGDVHDALLQLKGALCHGTYQWQ